MLEMLAMMYQRIMGISSQIINNIDNRTLSPPKELGGFLFKLFNMELVYFELNKEE